MKVNSIVFSIAFLLFSCKSSLKNEINSNCIYAKSFLEDMNLFIDEDCEIIRDNFNYFIHYKNKNNSDSTISFFLDYTSNQTLADLIVYENYNSFIHFDTIRIIASFENYPDIIEYGYSNIGLNSIKQKYSNEKLYKAHKYILKMGYINYVNIDEAIKKSVIKPNEKYFIYNILEDILNSSQTNASRYFDFIIATTILVKAKPEFKEPILDLYKIIGINSDTIITKKTLMYEYVRDNIDTTFVKPL